MINFDGVITNHSDPSARKEFKVQMNCMYVVLKHCVSHDVWDLSAVESLDAILQWLDAFRCIEKHVDTLLQRQSDTCAWLLKTTEYKEWLTAGESSFLWLHGKGWLSKSTR